MAREIRGVADSGTLYARIFNTAGLWWNGATFEAYASANYASYVVTMTEQGTSGVYVADFPALITTGGTYEFYIHGQSGVSPAEGDIVVGTGKLDWNGTTTVNPVPGADTVTDMVTLIRDNLDEASAGYWTDAEITRKIVRRFRELWSRIISIRDDWFKSSTPATVTLVANTLKYALPSDFFRTCTIRTTTSGKEAVQWAWMSCKDPRFVEGQRADVTFSDPGVIYYDIEGVTNIVVSPLPRATLVGSMEYYTLPTDPVSSFGLSNPILRYVEAGATADCLAKGPVGLIDYWRSEVKSAWDILLPILAAPRSGQNNSHALSPFEVP